jgi:hypothetical protein
MSLQKIVTTKRLYRGAPTIFVNDQPIHGGFVGTRGSNDLLGANPEGIAPLTYQNVDYQTIFIGPDGEYDTTGMEKDFAQIFEQHPQALGGLVLGMRPARDWIAANPGEMPVAAWPIDWMTNNRPDASWASEVWRQDSVKAVSHIVGRLHQLFKGRIIFYQIGAGRCGENGPQIHIDYSEPLLRHLRAWLRKRYNNDVDALRRAWSMPTVAFETATPPSPVEQMSTEWFAFRSPLRRQTADYFSAYSECVEHNILLWAEAVKKATSNESLTASPSASVLDVGLHTDLHGHLPKNTVRGYIDSPVLDMVESPASYGFRDLGRGDTTTLQPMGSVQLAGKMQLRDYDDRTHLTAWKAEEFPKCRLWEAPKDAWGDKQLMLRNTAWSLIKNGAFWWHELEKKMFSHPDHVGIVSRLQDVGRGAVQADRRMAQNGLAIFIQTEANFLQSSSNRLIFSMNYEARQLQWAHAGMASNIFVLEDAGHPDMPSPQVIMVTNAFTMSTAEADSVKALARKNNAAIVWLVAPGVQQPHGFDLEHTSRITGFKIRALDLESLPRITMRQNNFASGPGAQPIFQLGEEPKTAGARTLASVTWPDERPVSSFGGGQMDYDDAGARGTGPTFYVDVENDPEAIVLGDLDYAFKPGLVMRQCDGYRSIYCAAPYLHKALLRQLGHECGAHIYLDTDDLVHASRELLVVNARRAGNKTFRWPSRVEVIMDLYSGQIIAENTDHWEGELKKYETRFFFAGSKEIAANITAAMSDERRGVELL